jgi:hypothetical protein
VNGGATSKVARGLLIACALAASAGLATRTGVAAGGMILVIEFGRDNPEPRKPATAVHTIRDLSLALLACWRPPPLDPQVGPIDVNFTVSFKRSGELFGKPRVVTFAQRVTDEIRGRYYAAVAEAIDLCSQMPFTEQMRGAVAGTVFRVSFIDKRNSKRADASWPTTTTN